jgi:hypothetical protein
MTPQAAKRGDRTAFKVTDLESRLFPVVFCGKTKADCYAWIVQQNDVEKQRRGAYEVKPNTGEA